MGPRFGRTLSAHSLPGPAGTAGWDRQRPAEDSPGHRDQPRSFCVARLDVVAPPPDTAASRHYSASSRMPLRLGPAAERRVSRTLGRRLRSDGRVAAQSRRLTETNQLLRRWSSALSSDPTGADVRQRGALEWGDNPQARIRPSNRVPTGRTSRCVPPLRLASASHRALQAVSVAASSSSGQPRVSQLTSTTMVSPSSISAIGPPARPPGRHVR
jgi:hypothetical protein